MFTTPYAFMAQYVVSKAQGQIYLYFYTEVVAICLFFCSLFMVYLKTLSAVVIM
jgi:hypothetical protein